MNDILDNNDSKEAIQTHNVFFQKNTTSPEAFMQYSKPEEKQIQVHCSVLVGL
ncbi:MAG: hypothetical protein AAF770_01195 [Bacteroidota bacterium]